MHLELIGCTSVGKSTLAAKLLRQGASFSRPCMLASEFVRRHALLGRVQQPLVQKLAIHAAAAGGCLATRRSTSQITRFARRVLAEAGIPRNQRWNQLRKVLKQVGICQAIGRTGREDMVLIADEGSLHGLHNLFVHVGRHVDEALAKEFVELTPLPDLVIYLREDEEVLADRIIRRGHARIPATTPRSVIWEFVRNAQRTFDLAAEHPRLAGRVVLVERGKLTRVPSGGLPREWEAFLQQRFDERHEPVCTQTGSFVAALENS